MTHLRRRIIPPDVFGDPYLSPTDKRLFYIGLQQIAEDSGCLTWDARTLRAAILIQDGVTLKRVEEVMSELVDDGRVWPYAGANGRRYAYLPDFSVWQKNLGWFSKPEEVPLPVGITFVEYTDKHNAGRVHYDWPATQEELESTGQPDKAIKQGNESNPSKRTNELKGGVHSESTGSEHRVRSEGFTMPDDPILEVKLGDEIEW